MNPAEIRYLFDYDRWATERILALLDGVPHDVWSSTEVIGQRGLGGVLVHQLGAAQRWRNAIQQTGVQPRPEREPLPTVDELQSWWADEWVAVAGWMPTITQGLLDHEEDRVAVWQMLTHVINHGTQHRSEAAAILTDIGRSPGEIDMIFYVEGLVAGGAAPAD